MLVLAGPALAFLLTRAFCHALADRRRDEELHGRETGRIMRDPQGGYTEIREPPARLGGAADADGRVERRTTGDRGMAGAAALRRIGAAARRARGPEPGADDRSPPNTCTCPASAATRPAETRRWVQEVPIVRKTAKLIYYASDSWDRREAVVSPGCISREQFEADTRRTRPA